jgi:membrane protease YdiL (CAAX protease family)
MASPKSATLVTEFLLLFVVLPLAFRLLPRQGSPLPALWAAAAYCLYVLFRSSGFDSSRLWNSRPLSGSLGSILSIFAITAVITTYAVWRLRPQLFFGLVRNYPLLWALVMVLYPVFSVYPQGIVYRAFFCERYRPLFPQPAAMILASAAAFAFSHIIFRNSWSVALTFFAGLLFAWRYQATGSLMVSSLEHALYGCLMFTVGLGSLFYHGAHRAVLGR